MEEGVGNMGLPFEPLCPCFSLLVSLPSLTTVLVIEVDLVFQKDGEFE